jgi:hypothetical protein
VAVAITTRTSAFGGVGDDDVWTLLCGRNQLKSLVTRIERGGGLGRHDGQDFDALHVLLNVGAIYVTHDGAAIDKRGVQDTLRQLRAGGTPRRNVTIQTGYFDVNTPRHRAPI